MVTDRLTIMSIIIVAHRCAYLAALRTPPLAIITGGSRSALAPRTSSDHLRTTGSPDYQGSSIHSCSRRTVSFSMLEIKYIYKSFHGTPCPALFWERILGTYAPCVECLLSLWDPPSLTAALRIKATHHGTKAMISACGPGGGPFS